jgi:tetratricopeptide (TPR) repeat protein
LALVYSIVFIVFPLQVHAEESNQNNHLSQEELTNIPQLLRRFHDSSEEDKKIAEKFMKLANQAIARGNWGAAFKAYGESAVVKPSIEALLGLSVSISNISRKRSNCIEEISAKLRDFSSAMDYLESALEFSRKIGYGQKNILKSQRELIILQKKLIRRQAECLHLHSKSLL